MKSLRLAVLGLAAVTVFGTASAFADDETLPNDPKLLKALVRMYKSSLATKDAEVSKLIQDKNQATSQVVKLKEENARLASEIAKLKEDNARPVGGEKGTPALAKATKPDTGKDANSAETKTRVEKAEPKPTKPLARQGRSIEYMLATINAGTYVPEDDITVTRFRYLLQALDDKTTNTKQQIADMSVAAVTALRDKYGRNVTLLAFMDAMNAMLPAGERADYAVRTALYMQELKR